MKKFNETNHVKNLPDSYAKGNESNNYKILQTEKIAVDELRGVADITLKILDIDFDLTNATDYEKELFTATLNRYGEMLNQARGRATDEQYRYMLKSKIVQSLSGGDFNSVIAAICETFSCDPSEISIVELDEPCTIRVESLPISTITNAGFSLGQTMQIIKRLIPAGVDIESFYFEGTFEFAATEEDISVDGSIKGFTDTEANMRAESAVGGYFGMLSGGDEETLPI